MDDQIKKEIAEDLAYIGNEVASDEAHCAVLHTTFMVVGTGKLTCGELWELTELLNKIADRVTKE